MEHCLSAITRYKFHADTASWSAALREDSLQRDGLTPRAGGEAEPPLDAADLLDRLNGDRELLADLVAIFKTESERVLQEIRQLVLTSDAPHLEHVAHRLRGSVMAFGAAPAARAAREVETLARSGALTDAESYVCLLEREIRHLTVALDRLIESRDCENPDCRR
jgi:HPt (histidine-containing phosphotransfer) domain-containing protein